MLLTARIIVEGIEDAKRGWPQFNSKPAHRIGLGFYQG
jgi:hypothetical protein